MCARRPQALQAGSCLHNEPVKLCEVRVREPLQQHELALEVDGRALGPKVMRPPRLMQLAQQLQTPAAVAERGRVRPGAVEVRTAKRIATGPRTGFSTLAGRGALMATWPFVLCTARSMPPNLPASWDCGCVGWPGG